MQCEKCGMNTDIIKHIKIKNSINLVFKHNNSKDAMICMECYHNKPEFYGCYLVGTIRNDKL